jgi:hypothetical protein
MAKAQRDAIISALAACGYNILQAAQRLGIGRSTLYRFVEIYEIPMIRIPHAEGSPRGGRRTDRCAAIPPTTSAGPKIVFTGDGWYLEQR